MGIKEKDLQTVQSIEGGKLRCVTANGESRNVGLFEAVGYDIRKERVTIYDETVTFANAEGAPYLTDGKTLTNFPQNIPQTLIVTFDGNEKSYELKQTVSSGDIFYYYGGTDSKLPYPDIGDDTFQVSMFSVMGSWWLYATNGEHTIKIQYETEGIYVTQGFQKAVGSFAEPVWVTITDDGNGNFSTDTDSATIYNAVKNGRIVLAKWNSQAGGGSTIDSAAFLPLVEYNSNGMVPSTKFRNTGMMQAGNQIQVFMYEFAIVGNTVRYTTLQKTIE